MKTIQELPETLNNVPIQSWQDWWNDGNNTTAVILYRSHASRVTTMVLHESISNRFIYVRQDGRGSELSPISYTRWDSPTGPDIQIEDEVQSTIGFCYIHALPLIRNNMNATPNSI